jgi:hypothetical protein
MAAQTRNLGAGGTEASANDFPGGNEIAEVARHRTKNQPRSVDSNAEAPR